MRTNNIKKFKLYKLIPLGDRLVCMRRSRVQQMRKHVKRHSRYNYWSNLYPKTPG